MELNEAVRNNTFRRPPRIAAFIDGTNLEHTVWKQFPDKEINYSKLMDFFLAQGELFEAWYYRAENTKPKTPEQRQIAQKWNSFFEFLGQTGYHVHLKPKKEIWKDDGTVKIKGNLDIEIALDMVLTVKKGRIDRVYLFSDDGDFAYAIEKVQAVSNLISVIVVGSERVANELRAVTRIMSLAKLGQTYGFIVDKTNR